MYGSFQTCMALFRQSHVSLVAHMNGSSHTYEWVMSHMNESCRTYEWVKPRIWMSFVWHESCHTSHTWMSHARNLTWVLSHIWMRQVTHMNESCHTYQWVMSHTWMSHARKSRKWGHTCMSHVTHMYESCHTHVWVMSHTCMSHGQHASIWMSHVQHECIMPHTGMRPVTREDAGLSSKVAEERTHLCESRNIYEWVMSHKWMSHVTHVNASCHTRKTLEHQVKSQKREHILNLAHKAAAYEREELTWQDLVVTMVSSGLLQCVAGCCSVLQCVAACCSGIEIVWSSNEEILARYFRYYGVVRCVAVCCSGLQSVVLCCSVLQRVAVCCSASRCWGLTPDVEPKN